MLPCKEVVRLLEPAYRCAGFDDACVALTWAPERGFVPRGYCGTTGMPGDVRLVLVLDQPGEPRSDAAIDANAAPQEIIGGVCRDLYIGLTQRRDQFCSNLRFLLSRCFPGVSLEEQLRFTWITCSVLCSAPAGDHVPPGASLECRGRFLERQLALFSGASVVALGALAAKRLKGYPGLLEAADPAPPACNQPEARASWVRLGVRFAGH